jgi:hypothetical protein
MFLIAFSLFSSGMHSTIISSHGCWYDRFEALSKSGTFEMMMEFQTIAITQERGQNLKNL